MTAAAVTLTGLVTANGVAAHDGVDHALDGSGHPVAGGSGSLPADPPADRVPTVAELSRSQMAELTEVALGGPVEERGSALDPGEVKQTGKGLYKAKLSSGETVTTHGPDFRPYAASPPGFDPGDPERAPVCANDYYQRVIYAYPGVLPPDAAQRVAEIRSVMRRSNAVLNADSVASGGPNADFKVKCDGSGRIQVDTVAVPTIDAIGIMDAAASLGLVDSRADYTIFLDVPSQGWCGLGTYISDERPGENNHNNSGGGFAVIERACWNSTAPMHEAGHNQGAVQYSAPFSTGLGAHCATDYDVMCYSPDGGDLLQSGTTVVCSDRVHFDCGFDTYFDAATEPGEYLESHWNLGSPVNRFIAFSDGPVIEPDPAEGVPEDGTVPGEGEGPSGGGAESDTNRPEVVRVSPRKRKLRLHRGMRARQVTFRFRASESEVSYRCRLDARRWRRCDSPKRASLRRGKHKLKVRAIDQAGNRSKARKFKVTIRRSR